MISRLLFAVERSFRYIKEHPQMLFVLILLLVMPFLFLYSGQKFLEVGRQNQNTLQNERVGLMQDVFATLLTATGFNPTILQKEIEHISALNPDIVSFRIVEKRGAEFIPIAALDTSLLGVPEPVTDLYKGAALRDDETLLTPVSTTNGRRLLAYRSIQNEDGTYYFVYTQVSLQAVDAVFAAREREALYSLVFVYLFIIALAYWHIRLTDYRYLYLQVQKANEMKDLFTNLIAHELRAPLTAIRGYSSMLEEASANKEQKKYAVRIKDSSERLLAIVNDLLDVARIQSGKLSVTNESLNVSEVVLSVIEELQISASEKKIILKPVGAETEHIVVGDSKRLHQAFTNLVSNAIKYTKEGTIELEIQDTRTSVVVRVKDTGTGISSEDQKKLFAPFFRVQNEDMSKITGTGLGMWITKQLVELMGAKISVESIKGVGTHIVVVLNKK